MITAARVCSLMVALLQLNIASAGASRIDGSWEGTLEAGAMRLRIVFHLRQEAEGRFSGTMDSPDQGASGIPLSSVRLEGDSLLVEVRAAAGAYAGALSPGDTVVAGIWSQSGLRLPLRLRKGGTPERMRRPQEPVPPYPYGQEEVVFPNREAGITLAGTLTTPPGETPGPAVVLISGSGPQDRDESVFGHRPFLVLADDLTRRGISVLRFDDRGVGNSTGTLRGTTLEDLAGDVRAAVSFLRARPEIDPHRIGLLGHSEGGFVASMVAADSGAIAFLVLMASPGVPVDELLLLQSEALARASGISDEVIARTQALNSAVYTLAGSGRDSATLAFEAERTIRSWADSLPAEERTALGDLDTLLSRQIPVITSRWLRWALSHDPRSALRRVECPVLALTGGKDLQVLPRENLAGIRQALHEGGNSRAVVRELPGLNHLFQTAGTGLPAEYGVLEETIAPSVLTLIGEWITTVAQPSSPAPQPKAPSGRP